MGNFHDVYANHLTVAECDKIAIYRGGIYYATGYGYGCPKGGPVNEEYRSIVVNTQGMGNHGKIVLKGLTPRARALLREGKIMQHTRQGVPWRTARVSIHYRYGMEVPVCMLADAMVETFRVRGEAPRVDSHYALDDWLGWQADPLTFPRKNAAIAIAAAVAGVERK